MLINNVIHPGEPYGVDASMMLLPNIALNPAKFPEMDRVVLEKSPELKKRQNDRKKAEPEFAESGEAQLNFIYENSDYAEKGYCRYPVFRLMKK